MNPTNPASNLGDDNLVSKAADFAANAHAGQSRKYTGEPYIVHPGAVAATVSSVTEDPVTITAAWLHDVVEDTPVTIDQIEKEFGTDCAAIVSSVTNPSKSTDGNRAARKAIDRQHLTKAPPNGKTVKLADVIDNIRSIVKHDSKFAKVYLLEKRALLPLLQGGNSELFTKAEQALKEAERVLARGIAGKRPNNRKFVLRLAGKPSRSTQTLGKSGSIGRSAMRWIGKLSYWIGVDKNDEVQFEGN